MKRNSFLLLFIVVFYFFSCKNNSDGELFYTGFNKLSPLINKDKFTKDTISYIVSYYDFDCSMCIGEMTRVSNTMLDYSNVCFIISSNDSISALYYLSEIKPNATVLWDKYRTFFLKNAAKFNLTKEYCVFVVKNNRLIYARNPFQNKFETLRFKLIIRQFKEKR